MLLSTCGTQSIDTDTSRTAILPTRKNFPVNSRSTNLGGHTVGLLARALKICSSKSTRKRRRK
jgi:hypothetical protein